MTFNMMIMELMIIPIKTKIIITTIIKIIIKMK